MASRIAVVEWTWAQDLDLFLGLAGVAGVFVGFAALIGFSHRHERESADYVNIRGVVTIGLLVLVVTLVPVVLGRYEVAGHSLWLTSSLAFLGALWTVSILGLRRPENRAAMALQAKSTPVMYAFFWLVLEVPIQVPLILIVIGVLPDHEPGLYTTAVVFQLFEAAYVLAQVAYAEPNPEEPARQEQPPVSSDGRAVPDR